MCHNLKIIQGKISKVPYLEDLEGLFQSYLQSSSLSLINKRCEILNNKLDKLEENVLQALKTNQSFEDRLFQDESHKFLFPL